MAGFITREECSETVSVLATAYASLPTNDRALRAVLRGTLNEYTRAARMYDRVLDDHGEGAQPEIRHLGSLAMGEIIQLARALTVRRVSETGVCVFVDGKEVWENFRGRTTPIVVAQIEVDR